jgi:hypothetical protein
MSPVEIDFYFWYLLDYLYILKVMYLVYYYGGFVVTVLLIYSRGLNEPIFIYSIRVSEIEEGNGYPINFKYPLFKWLYNDGDLKIAYTTRYQY